MIVLRARRGKNEFGKRFICLNHAATHEWVICNGYRVFVVLGFTISIHVSEYSECRRIQPIPLVLR